MPRENETKFVTNGYEELEALLTPGGWQDIEQGYFNSENRIRRITYPDGTRQHFFTFKKRLIWGDNLEIEPPISEAQFDEAWEHTNERLRKRRVSIEHDNLKWDIDFYRWPAGARYFVLAEVEMPEHMSQPTAILPHLVPHMVYEVPREDNRFAARRLADATHAETLARSLRLL
jgi:CYTH domain-containing protein